MEQLPRSSHLSWELDLGVLANITDPGLRDPCADFTQGTDGCADYSGCCVPLTGLASPFSLVDCSVETQHLLLRLIAAGGKVLAGLRRLSLP